MLTPAQTAIVQAVMDRYLDTSSGCVPGPTDHDDLPAVRAWIEECARHEMTAANIPLPPLGDIAREFQ